MRALASTRAPAGRERSRAGLYEDRSGAIMVVGAFLAAFLVGLLYYGVGLAETMLYRERMQDASDAVAFSAAVMNARGMNLIAFINIIMAAVLAVLVALRAVELLCIAGIAIAAGLSWITGGASLAAIPPLTAVRNAVNTAYNSAKPVVENILRIGHKAGVAVRRGMPFVSQGRAVLTAMTAYNPPAYVGFVFPLARPLPTEDAPYSELCDKSAEFVTDLVMIPLNPILGFLGPVRSWVRGAINGFSHLAAMTVCGGTAPPPDYGVSDEELARPLPRSATQDRCESEGGDAVCAQAREEMERSAFTPPTGECRDGAPYSSTQRSLCETRLRQAAAECQPRTGGARLMQWSWQIAYWSYTVSMDDEGRIFRTPRAPDTAAGPINPRMEGPSNRPPCGRGGSVATTYDPTAAGPTGVCGDDVAEAEVRAGVPTLRRGGSVVVRYRTVQAILGCKEEREELSGGFDGGPSGGNDMSPQRVPRDLMLGDEEFQMRGVVIGGMQFNRNDRGVQIATGGRNPGGAGVYSAIVNLGRLSLAQAEFFYDGSEDHSQWLWNMKWRGRLRRFRMPPELGGSDGGSRLEAACSNSDTGGGGCSGAGGLDLSGLENVIVH